MNEHKLENNFSEEEFGVLEFTNQIHSRIKICPMYYNLGFSASPLIFGRAAVLRRLHEVIASLPTEYGVLVWDVYRPRTVQASLFDWMTEEVRKRSPHLTDQENYQEATKYMSAPTKIGDEYCPPHLSGGAIDLTLYNTKSGKPLDLGTAFDDCSERAHRDYFIKKTNLSIEEQGIKERRELLRNLMEAVGFTSYQYEWWHFDIGNIFWSKNINRPAAFGPLFGDEELPKDFRDIKS